MKLVKDIEREVYGPGYRSRYAKIKIGGAMLPLFAFMPRYGLKQNQREFLIQPCVATLTVAHFYTDM